MKIIETKFAEIKLITLDVFDDERGHFVEAWQIEKLHTLGLSQKPIKQYNVSKSARGVIRGIHKEPWDKYIYVPHGRVFAAIVDLRKESKSFGAYVSFELDHTRALFVPEGFGNSYQALEDDTIYTYLVTDVWCVEDAPYPAVRYDDPSIGINWPIVGDEMVVSEKDMKNPLLDELA